MEEVTWKPDAIMRYKFLRLFMNKSKPILWTKFSLRGEEYENGSIFVFVYLVENKMGVVRALERPIWVIYIYSYIHMDIYVYMYIFKYIYSGDICIYILMYIHIYIEV